MTISRTIVFLGLMAGVCCFLGCSLFLPPLDDGGTDGTDDPGSPESSVDMITVAGGEFEMGDSFNEGNADELPVHAVSLSPYDIDKYEVTNQEYADALNWAWDQGGLITVTNGIVYRANDGASHPYCDTTTSSSYSRISWDGDTFGVTAGKEDHPMAQVSWYGSAAYCNWRSAREGKPLCYDLSSWTCDFSTAGYRLPTEAEWEMAAGWDPAAQYHFRFGEQTDGCGADCLDGQRANYWDSYDPYEPGSAPDTTPVGFYDGSLHDTVDFGWPGSVTSYQTQDAQSYYGCYDMSGNVGEWCHDWYAADYYDTSPGADPQGASSGLYRVLRGGAFASDPDGCRSAYRYRKAPNGRSLYYGFRCVTGTH